MDCITGFRSLGEAVFFTMSMASGKQVLALWVKQPLTPHVLSRRALKMLRQWTSSGCCNWLLRKRILFNLTYSLTYSTEQSSSWEAKSFSASQETPRILWNPKVHDRVHKCALNVPILSQISPVHAPTFHILFNLIGHKASIGTILDYWIFKNAERSSTCLSEENICVLLWWVGG